MKFDHVALNVKNISSAVEWYQNEYCAEVVYHDDSWALVKIGETKIAFTLESHHPPHIGFCVESVADFPDGSEIGTHRDGSMYHYKTDPWGNTREFIKY